MEMRKSWDNLNFKILSGMAHKITDWDAFVYTLCKFIFDSTTTHHSNNPRLSPVMRGTPQEQALRGHSNVSNSSASSSTTPASSITPTSMTSPVAVPSHLRKAATDCRQNSPGLGRYVFNLLTDNLDYSRF